MRSSISKVATVILKKLPDPTELGFCFNLEDSKSVHEGVGAFP